jgi:hypothetical protein
VLALTAACSSARSGAEGQAADSGKASLDSVPDPALRPVVLILRRDSLRLQPNAPIDSVRSAIDRAVAELRRTAEFDVLAVSPAILAVNIRARGGRAPADLATTLRSHPFVASAEVEGYARRQP